MKRYAAIVPFIAWCITMPIANADEPEKATNDPRWHDLPNTHTVFKPTKYASLEEWKQRRQWLREQVRFAAGLVPEPERTPLNARIFGRIERDGYTVEKVHFESRPGFYVTGNLYRPTGVKGKVPAVACPHGHWKTGRLAHEELGSIPARCITLARLGAVAFSYDMIGYNDSGKQLEHKGPHWNKPEFELWGIGPLQLQTWNSIRVLDFLQSLPDVDPQRIGVTGASGGGTQTFILSAVDDRVKVACPVNMISSTMQGGCICENAACLRIETDNMEIGALFAPKPLLMVSATGDWTKLTPTVEYPMIRSIYELYGAADKVANVHVDAPHNYNLQSREAMYRFFAKHLLKRDDADRLTEGDIQPEKPEDLLVFTDDNLPENMLTFKQLAEQLKAADRRRIEAMKPTTPTKLRELSELVRAGVRQAVGSSLPCKNDLDAPVESEPTDDQHPLYRFRVKSVRNQRPVRGHSAFRGGKMLGSRHTTVGVHPKGLDARGEIPLPAGLHAEAKYDMLLIEPFGFGQSLPPTGAEKTRGSTKFFTTFNRTDAAETIFDILTVLAGLGQVGENTHPVNLVAAGELGPLCLVARVLVTGEITKSGKLRTVIDMNGFDIDSDEAYLKQLNIPNIRKIGGLRAIAAVAANGPIWFHNVADHFDAEWVQAAGKLNGVEVKITRDKATTEQIAAWLAKDP